MTATVTVVVPTYNRAEFLGQALDSLLGQTLPPTQVIVVDDGSTDGTDAVVQAYAGRVEYVRQPNGGKAAAVNAGLARARGEYVWVFDDDDVAVPDALARFVGALDGREECGFAYSTCLFTLDGPNHRLGDVIGETWLPPSGGLLLPLLEGNFLSGAALFARTECYQAVGGFDERLIRSQDYDLAIRMVRRCAGVRVPGGPTFHARQHGGARGSAQDRFTAAEKSEKWRQYDELVFRKVRDELGLEEYLPPVDEPTAGGAVPSGAAAPGLAGREREALLRRFFLLALRLPFAEVAGDLRAAARLHPGTRLTSAERAIVRAGVAREVHGQSLARNPEFLDEVRRLARGSRSTSARGARATSARASRAGRSLRAEVARVLSTTWPSRHARTAASRLAHAAAALGRLLV